MSNTSRSSSRVSTPTKPSIKNNPKSISPNQVRDILKATNQKSLSPPNSENMKTLEPFLPQLFNLSRV